MKKFLLLLGLFLTPVLGYAQELEANNQSLSGLLDFVISFINSAIPVIVSLAVLVFIWGVFRYVVSSDEEAKGKGKNMMLWGIVGIFVMVSVWGLVNILDNTFNLKNDPVKIPELPKQR